MADEIVIQFKEECAEILENVMERIEECEFTDAIHILEELIAKLKRID